MRSRKAMLPGFSPFKKGDNPISKKLKEYKSWRKKQKSKHNIIEATVPDIPFLGPGGIRKGAKVGKSIIDAFNKGAKHRRNQIKTIEESLKKKGYTFKKKSPLNAIDSRRGDVAEKQAMEKKQHKAMRKASRFQK